MCWKRTILLCLLAGGIGGCNAASMDFLASLFVPPQRSVPAEYDGLADKVVAVVVFSDQQTDFEYPDARLATALSVGQGLLKNAHVKGVVDARRIVRFQDENLNWDTRDKTALGRSFGADRVLYVTLVEYSTREPSSQFVYRGRIIAEVSVYDTSRPERDARVWRAEKNIDVSYPEQSPVGAPGESERDVRIKAQQLFADTVAKKFYKHKVPNP